MKMIMVAYNEAIDMEVMEVLKNCGAVNYTKMTGVFGKGKTSGVHDGTDIWPGLNNVLLAATPDENVPQLMSCITHLRMQLGAEGVKAFVWRLEEMT